MARERNHRLAALIAEIGWSQAQVANHFVRVARELGHTELLGVRRSHVSMWLRGTRPSGHAPVVLAEALSRGVGRPLTVDQIGLDSQGTPWPQADPWQADTLSSLTDIGGDSDVRRRQFLSSAVYSVAGLALPEAAWWQESLSLARRRPSGRQRITPGDIDAIRQATALFQNLDQRRGGGYATSTALAFLTEEVTPALRRSTPSEALRRDLFSAASELVYAIGWACFDSGRHGAAQHFFQLSVKLAAEADDPALAGHVLRAMSHQALDLGHYRHAVDLAAASLDRAALTSTSSRERALLGVVHARSLAEVGEHRAAARALIRAEDDLSSATVNDAEPARVWFFGEASLAHETARTLHAMGDLPGAQREFHRSVRTRRSSFRRTHAVTLGYLGELQARQGEIEAACATWSQALDTMGGIRSGRARDTVVTMRRTLRTVKGRGIPAVTDLDVRAAQVLHGVL